MKFITIASSVVLALALGTELASAECAKLYGQCGGKEWKGPTCCESGSRCTDLGNEYYLQCLPSNNNNNNNNNNNGHKTTTTTKHTKTSSPPTHTPSKPSKPSTPSTSGSGYSPVSGGASGNGRSTRYWDCCKASCSWPGKADVTAPVDTCAKNGVSIVDDNTQSGCNGGSGYIYGGISDASQCSQLPAALQAGCKFRFGWFKNADNPSVSFKEVTCPKEIVQRTGCQRK
ncbi:Putative Endo-beta-1,4-D-glucanase [Rhizopus microsporus]|nr:Putative Endo-beta-1,4-D-glucanase [Rhizopus microsporus]